MAFAYENHWQDLLTDLKKEGRYRSFANLSRQNGSFPYATWQGAKGPQKVVVWCSNDYLSMGQHPLVIDAMQQALLSVGAGAGGTRNIAGTSHYHVELENLIANWYQKASGLIFSSGYVANEAALGTLARVLGNVVVFSDEQNHASMIAGIKSSGAEKYIFRHNDLEHLEYLLKQQPISRPKIIAFESVYSMQGDIAPIAAICDLAKKYNALTYLDEVHGVGLYGRSGCGVAERDGVLDQVDVVQGTFGKAIGVVGGYVVGSKQLVDVIRSYAAPFIFTTSLPPVIVAGVIASIKYLRNATLLRKKHQLRAVYLKSKLIAAGLPVLNGDSHIVPLMIRNADCCRRAAEKLLEDFSIYVQPINYPTVPKGTERFRLTPGLGHSDAMIDALVSALCAVWDVHAIAEDAQII